MGMDILVELLTPFLMKELFYIKDDIDNCLKKIDNSCKPKALLDLRKSIKKSWKSDSYIRSELSTRLEKNTNQKIIVLNKLLRRSIKNICECEESDILGLNIIDLVL